MPGASPISELFHGTMTSDFGASWLPRIDMPDSVFVARRLRLLRLARGGRVGCRSLDVLTGFFAPTTAAVGAAASSATAEPLATSNETETIRARCMCPPSDSHGCRRSAIHFDGLLVVRHRLLVRLVVCEGAVRVREVQVAEDRKVAVREVEVRDERERLLVARTRFGELALLAVDHAELVVRDRMARVDLERARKLASARSRSPVRHTRCRGRCTARSPSARSR